ncbi:hypothetical protein JOB18_047788 [Solea senegalensis]|uniref:Uncharacterized protein n=1 Tax=Solea senegalensis TaxID=28829 RepID=A0AAV6SBU8_SOLSE|nr:hypothetical protein JOB18_047788 [Solea senegalensis]
MPINCHQEMDDQFQKERMLNILLHKKLWQFGYIFQRNRRGHQANLLSLMQQAEENQKIAEKVQGERRRQPILRMLRNALEENNLRADLDDIQKTMADDLSVVSGKIDVLQQELDKVKALRSRKTCDADVLTLRQKTEDLLYEFDKETKAIEDSAAQKILTMNNMKAEHTAFCQKMMEELKVEKESKLILQEELKKVRDAKHEQNHKYEADLHTARHHADLLQQELTQSHTDTFSKHQLFLQNLRTEQDVFCQKITEEIELVLNNAAKQETFLLRDIEKLKSQLNVQRLLYLELHMKFKVEIESGQEETAEVQTEETAEVRSEEIAEVWSEETTVVWSEETEDAAEVQSEAAFEVQTQDMAEVLTEETVEFQSESTACSRPKTQLRSSLKRQLRPRLKRQLRSKLKRQLRSRLKIPLRSSKAWTIKDDTPGGGGGVAQRLCGRAWTIKTGLYFQDQL